jgi:predicted negative regulator of RcsB-dependent stress response
VLTTALAVAGGAKSAEMMGARALLYAGLGRLDQAGHSADSLRAMNQEMALGIRLLPVFLQIVPDSFAAGEIAALRSAPRRSAEVVGGHVDLALAAGDLTTARRLVDSALVRDSTVLGGFPWGVLTARRGRVLLAQGDTATAIDALRAGINRVGPNASFLTTAARLDLATVLANRPATRAEGLRMLEWGFSAEFHLTALVDLLHGEALERAGDRAGAVAKFSRVLRLWDRATTEGGLGNRARIAMRRLTGEGTPVQ